MNRGQFTTKISQESVEVAIDGIAWLLKLILQPSNDIVNDCKKWMKWSSTEVGIKLQRCHASMEPHGKRASH